MSTEEFLRGIFAFFLALSVAYAVHCQNDPEFQLEDSGPRDRYRPLVAPLLLPAYYLILLVTCLAVKGADYTVRHMLSLWFGVFLHISVYDLALLLLLPLLRRWISARTCAFLWQLPNFMYLTGYTWMRLPAPKLLLKWDGYGLVTVLAVWAAGFAAVLIWKTAGHLRFRRRLLHHARPVTDEAVLALWRREQEQAGVTKANLRLSVSCQTASPLSIGLFRHTTRVVLPEQPYTLEDLTLIFRHELIHIRRQDSGTKFFLVFCTAICWFNPLMWIAMGRCAEDLELSCDETVLMDANSAVRRRYAELILNAAGDGRGYTTCLSSAASALRYRLKNAAVPRKRLVGGVLAGVLFFALLMSSGYVALVYGGDSAGALVFHGQPEEAVFLSETVNWHTENGYVMYDYTDQAALTDYIAGLRLYHVTGSYSFSGETRRMTILFSQPYLCMDLTEHCLIVTTLGKASERTAYYLSGPVDWSYLQSLLTPYQGE